MRAQNKPETFGDLLRSAIAKDGRSVAAIAAAAGLSDETIHQLLRTNTDPRWSTVCALADALDLWTDELRAAGKQAGL